MCKISKHGRTQKVNQKGVHFCAQISALLAAHSVRVLHFVYFLSSREKCLFRGRRGAPGVKPSGVGTGRPLECSIKKHIGSRASVLERSDGAAYPPFALVPRENSYNHGKRVPDLIGKGYTRRVSIRCSSRRFLAGSFESLPDEKISIFCFSRGSLGVRF